MIFREPKTGTYNDVLIKGANEAAERDRSPMSLSTAERAVVRPASGSGLCLSAPECIRSQGCDQERSILETTGPRADGCSAGLFGQRAVFVQFKDPEFQHNFYSSMHQEFMHPTQELVNASDQPGVAANP